MKTHDLKSESKSGDELTGRLRLAIGPLGDGKVYPLARYCFSLVRLLEAIPNQIRTDV